MARGQRPEASSGWSVGLVGHLRDRLGSMPGSKSSFRCAHPRCGVPNKETLEALREARQGKNLERYDSLEELKAAFES